MLLEPLEDGRDVAVGTVAGVVPALAVAAAAVAAAAAIADGVVGAGAVVGPAVVRTCLAFGAVGGAGGLGFWDWGLGIGIDSGSRVEVHTIAREASKSHSGPHIQAGLQKRLSSRTASGLSGRRGRACSMC